MPLTQYLQASGHIFVICRVIRPVTLHRGPLHLPLGRRYSTGNAYTSYTAVLLL